MNWSPTAWPPRQILAKRPHPGYAVRLLVLTAAVGSVACVGTGEGIPDAAPISSAVPRSYLEIVQLVFDPLCAQQCHRGGAAPKGLSLEAGRELSSMVGVPAVEVPSMLRIAPGSPEESYLVVKLASSDPRRVGARMPRNGPPFVTDGQLRAIRAWIRDGATEDWVYEPEADASPPPPDASAVDASAIDASAIDASAIDASAIDASAVDASAIDASAIDASAIDAGL